MRKFRESDVGFTLIELLVVMIIIGILAAIAIPVFLTQRGKARDAATKSDVTRVGKEFAAYFVDGKGTLSLDATTTPGSVIVRDDATSPFTSTLTLSAGTTLSSVPLTGQSNSTGWCVSLSNAAGAVKTFKFSAAGGLAAGTC